ncbi:MAG: hypothetical protein WCT04_09735 [Planctomycetota bacterium]
MQSKLKKSANKKEEDFFKEYKGKYLLCWIPADYDALRMSQEVGVASYDGKPIVSNGFPDGTITYTCIENALSEYFPI